MGDSTHGVATRAMAARAVDQVLNSGTNLESALSGCGFDHLEARDRAFVRALSAGTLRTHLRNLYIIRQLVDRPLKRKDSLVTALLSTGLHALTESVAPDYAVVSATVAATRKLGKPMMKGFVNAVLRRFLREREQLLSDVEGNEEAHWQHPRWLIEKIRSDWPDCWETLLAAGNQQAPMWLRVNSARGSRDAYLQRLAKADITATGPADFPDAVLLNQAVGIDKLPGFQSGDCSVQDAASQIATVLLAADPGMRVLDACAAPGGKTCHLLEHAGGALSLCALDSSSQRLTRVEENLERLHLSATVICGDALRTDEWWDGELFDRILVDAPCSATGVIRRHPDIRFLRRETDIAALIEIQSSMLSSLWRLLKPGGRLLYSTCSILHEENAGVVESFLAVHGDAAEVPLHAMVPRAFVTSQGAQFLPGHGDTDGFYYALMERTD